MPYGIAESLIVINQVSCSCGVAITVIYRKNGFPHIFTFLYFKCWEKCMTVWGKVDNDKSFRVICPNLLEVCAWTDQGQFA